MRRRAGFTLLELAFVLILLAGILGLLYQIFHAQSSTSRRLDAHQEALRAGLFAMEFVCRDLKHLVTIPVERRNDGTVIRHYGDAVTPCKIGPLGQQISFYVADDRPVSVKSPDAPCHTLTFSLWPAAPGVFQVRRTVGPVPGTGGGAAPPRGDATDHVLPEVLVTDLRFRLLEPGHALSGQRSPDDSYYVEVFLVGVDRRQEHRRELPGLVHLDHPSQMAATRFLGGVIRYLPKNPLVTPEADFRPTPAELALVAELRQLTRRFTVGKMPAVEFSQAVQKLLAAHAGHAVTATIGGTGVRLPTFENLAVRPYEQGQPVMLATPTGDTMALMTDSTQLNALMAVVNGAVRVANAAPAQPVAEKDQKAARARAWWVDLNQEKGTEVDLAGMLGNVSNSFGPMVGEADRQ